METEENRKAETKNGKLEVVVRTSETPSACAQDLGCAITHSKAYYVIKFDLHLVFDRSKEVCLYLTTVMHDDLLGIYLR